MLVGVPKEIKVHEYRVGLTPSSVRELITHGHKVIVHGDELGDRIVGIMGGYIRWAGLVEDSTKAIAMTERLTGRQLDPFARDVIMTAADLRV